jgi:hypothetical protein
MLPILSAPITPDCRACRRSSCGPRAVRQQHSRRTLDRRSRACPGRICGGLAVIAVSAVLLDQVPADAASRRSPARTDDQRHAAPLHLVRPRCRTVYRGRPAWERAAVNRERHCRLRWPDSVEADQNPTIVASSSSVRASSSPVRRFATSVRGEHVEPHRPPRGHLCLPVRGRASDEGRASDGLALNDEAGLRNGRLPTAALRPDHHAPRRESVRGAALARKG